MIAFSFDLTSWYGVIAVVAAGYLLWTAVFETGHRHLRSIRSHLFPPPPKPPIVVLSGPGFRYNTEPLRHERRVEQEQLLMRLVANFKIENKEALMTVTKLEAGVRRKDDGREQRFEAFNAPALAPLSEAPVSNFEVDPPMFEGLVESDFQAAFVWWARFAAPAGTRWEIAFDGEAQNFLDARVVAQQ